MIVTNFKTYESATGLKALDLARIHEQVADETGADIRIAVQAVDLRMVADDEDVKIPILAQHIDGKEAGSGTGHILPEAVQEAGAKGTLLNHSERRISEAEIEHSVNRAKELGLTVILCAESPEEGEKFLKYDPDFVAYEPPELIGGDISVSTAKPDIIKHAAQLIGSDKLLVGAGVKNGADVKKSIELGAVGVLLASGVTKASDPKAVLMDLVSGL